MTAPAIRLRKRGPAAEGALLMAAGALTGYFAFNGGGYFAGEVGRVAVIVVVILVLRVTLARRPFDGFSPLLASAAACLALFAIWALISAGWSHSPGRAMIEFDRALLYWLVLVLSASVAVRAGSLETALRGLAVAIVVVCVCGLITRVLPEVWPIRPNLLNERLSYPLTYWNGLGLLAAFGLVLNLYLSSSLRERAWVRVLSAAVCPLLAATMLLTLSRGAIAVSALGAVMYLVLARPRGAPGAVLAIGLPVTVAILVAYDADLLLSERPTTRAAAEQGHDVALTLVACVAGAALLRLLALWLDRRLKALTFTVRRARLVLGGLAAATLLGVLAGAIVLDAPARAERLYDRFIEGSGLDESKDLRGRLADPGSNGRIEQWDAALSAFRADPLQGAGAGTFPLVWAQNRETPLKVEDAHSLYVETLGELGLPGLLVLALALAALWIGVCAAYVRERRPATAVALALVTVWLLHAGIDWDWEQPAVTAWLFAIGGLCLARPRRSSRPGPARLTRVVVGSGLLALAVTPALMAISQAHLNDGVDALRRGDCGRAIDASLASTHALGVRPQPFLVMSLCDSRLDRHAVAQATAARATELDPLAWEGWYTLAIARANAGRDPRGAARRAARLNPRAPLTRDLRRALRTNDPQKWRRRARAARLPLL